ncbi:hypothetical protein NPIL_551741 [Nephila pilipes]|uniref:Uncharacterized protein n=1 Tax=Nephila pilipes TaxID=299642 RepID=A0A8X6QBH3_NEPPI|nr:hypothetical protein NPIL_551741 [Nephila pilipes]
MKKIFQLKSFGALFPQVKPEDAILSECYNLRRINWLLRIATKLPPERDKFSRLVQVKSENFELLKLVQRLIRWKCRHIRLKSIQCRRQGKHLKLLPSTGRKQNYRFRYGTEVIVPERI